MEKIKKFILDSKQRIITALVLVFILGLLVALDNFFLIWLTLGVVYLISVKETCELFKIDNFQIYIFAISLWIASGFYSTIFVVLLTMVVYTSIMLQTQSVKLKSLTPFVYPTIPMVMLLSLYDVFGIKSLIWLILIVSFTDMGAYVVGKFCGKHKFSPISPNKTWEGTLGGIAIGTLVGSIYTSGSSFGLEFAISLCVSVASVWGDLFESYLKRASGVKDSGSIFPGHGGMLDRIDGYLFGVVAMSALLEGLV